jgi:hypothetical protein
MIYEARHDVIMKESDDDRHQNADPAHYRT